MDIFEVLGLVALCVFIVIAYDYIKDLKYKDMKISRPETRREGLMHGYYAADKRQVEETRDHVNLHWDIHVDDVDALSDRIKSAGLFTVLDVNHYMFEKLGKENFKLRGDAADRLRSFLKELQTRDVLKYVKGMTVIDEPNLNTTESDYRAAVAIEKFVVAEFPELSDIKYFCIYTGFHDFFATELVDVVGFDYYARRSAIFRKFFGKYWELKKLLKPGQMTILVPGGATASDVYEQDPEPFVAFAQRNSEVFGMVSFLYISSGDEIKGIRDNRMLEKYVEAGKYLIGK